MNKVVAIHYREKSEVQGCWKEFDNVSDAVAWINLRKRKTASSPQGSYITDQLEELQQLIAGPEIGLGKAAASYLKYRKILK